MPTDMKGYKVVYENQAYKCLMVEPIWDSIDSEPKAGLRYPWWLQVTIIDHDAKFAVIEDYAKAFAFLKEEKV